MNALMLRYWHERWQSFDAVTVFWTGHDSPFHFAGRIMLAYNDDRARVAYMGSDIPSREA